MFDRNLRRRSAGIYRYAANGVHIHAGPIRHRPGQVETIDVSEATIGERPDDAKTVLYATTWVGLMPTPTTALCNP